MHEERQENPEEGQNSKVQNQSNQHLKEQNVPVLWQGCELLHQRGLQARLLAWAMATCSMLHCKR
jgi:hypothetical protein